ncbi:CGP-CTERM sorting domain-containing protein [Thermococcus sp. Bubb.Bath]|uniref:CGP-CTERM sorting domain-containing protein n=1 Tax=Thermococcus sp. Bubb.Bath TaxID=1638242 RepID=UPI001439DB3B|nr:CGP-CTERM sorting domain-containing protein [Thermococcus sp. Bubb.Bath]NJF24293.1 CGP-CTERM sorting domain-containing protein [Thermococcus sp. Bubb.Bath]
MRKIVGLLAFVFLLLLLIPSANSVSVWEGLSRGGIYYINIEGYSPNGGAPPWNPLNDSSITWINIGYEYNETHTFNEYYEGGKWKEGFFHKHGRPKPFNMTDWNWSKVLEEYQWGVENYLPNISGNFSFREWKKGYWNSSISRWNMIINSNHVKITLHTLACEGSGECDEYITFECQRNGSNVTCKWGKPVFKVYHNVPPIGRTTTTSETTSRITTTSTTTSSSSTQPTTTSETTSKTGTKICGPGLLIGLVLAPVLLRRVKR